MISLHVKKGYDLKIIGKPSREVEELKKRLEADNIYLQDEIKLVHNFENIITQDDLLKKILRRV